MKKLTFVMVAGLGFVLGSKAGRAPYEHLEARARALGKGPEIQDAAQQVGKTVTAQTGAIARTVAKLPGGRRTSDTTVNPPATPPEHYADPQDLEFGKAAAEKEETLDALLAQGGSVQEVEASEQRQLEEGSLNLPRAANQQQLADGNPRRDI